jgi:3-hydroxyisobutyrate dehydrogenase
MGKPLFHWVISSVVAVCYRFVSTYSKKPTHRVCQLYLVYWHASCVISLKTFEKARQIMNIGYVGLGAMGGALAKWLITDHDLTVWDLNPAAIERFEGFGAKAAASLTDLARACDVIFLCLPRSSDVEKAIFGESGLIHGLSEGKTVVDQTSGLGSATQSMAARLQEIGVDMIDAPVAGGVPSAVGGTITIMVSGPDAAQDRVMLAFQSMTSKIYRASAQAGDAQSVKTLNNMMNMVYRVATLELVALAMRLGGKLSDLSDQFNGGIAGNFTTRTVLPALVSGRSTGDFALTLMLKDNNQALNLGMAADVPMPMSALGRAVLQQNINVIGEKANLDDVARYMSMVTGVDFASDTTGKFDPDARAAIETALALANRAIAYEILSVATKMWMPLFAFSEIVNNGSAWSHQCEVVVKELRGAAPATITFGVAVDALQSVERLNTYYGVATIMLGEVRTLYEMAAQEFGKGASISTLAKYYERVGQLSFAKG